MENGSYELIEQIGQIGFYGCIKLGVEVVEDQLNSMEIDSDFEIDPYYLKGIRCGVEYFTAHTLLDLKNKSLKIKIKDLKEHEVDSTFMIMMFITIKALIKALNTSIYKEPYIDFQNKLICFPH